MSGLALGALVTVDGVVVGRTEFQEGEPTYLVAFRKRGKPAQEWFYANEVELDEEEQGSGI